MGWLDGWRGAQCGALASAGDLEPRDDLTFAELDGDHRAKLREVLRSGVSDAEIESALGVLGSGPVYVYTAQSNALARSVLGHALLDRLTGAVRCADAAAARRLLLAGNGFGYGGAADVLRAMDRSLLGELRRLVDASTRRMIDSLLAER